MTTCEEIYCENCDWKHDEWWYDARLDRYMCDKCKGIRSGEHIRYHQIEKKMRELEESAKSAVKFNAKIEKELAEWEAVKNSRDVDRPWARHPKRIRDKA